MLEVDRQKGLKEDVSVYDLECEARGQKVPLEEGREDKE